MTGIYSGHLEQYPENQPLGDLNADAIITLFNKEAHTLLAEIAILRWEWTEAIFG